jgi:dCMP deaminase
MSNWDNKFIGLAKHISEWSKDTNRKNGAVIVDTDNNVLSLGYNGLPRGCDDSIESRYEQPTKYFYFEHAERNSIYHAARNGVVIKNAKMYMTMFCCSDCARAIIQSGITEIIAPQPDLTHPKWGEHFQSAIEMLKEANVKINHY